jgi:hypothetical protein
MLSCVSVSENTVRQVKPLVLVYNGMTQRVWWRIRVFRVVEVYGEGLLVSPSKTKNDTELYRLFQGESAVQWENLPWVKLPRYSQKHAHISEAQICTFYPKFSGYGVDGERRFKEWKLLYIC